MNAHAPAVAEYMSPVPYAVGPNEPLEEARQLMNRHRIRHLPVVTDGELIGLLSERDLQLVWTLAHAPTDRLTVEDAMTADPYTVPPSTPIQVAAREMAHRRIGSAVVVDRGAIAGVFTSTDAMHALADVLDGDVARRMMR